MAFIGPLVQALIGGLVAITPSIVARVLAALGLSYMAYAGLQEGVNQLVQMLSSNMNSLSGSTLQFLRFAGVTTGLNIILASLVSWATIKATSGALRFMMGAK